MNGGGAWSSPLLTFLELVETSVGSTRMEVCKACKSPGIRGV
jgi:hypothetical protein